MAKQNWQQLVDEIGMKAALRMNPGRVDMAAGYSDDDSKGRISTGKSAVRGPGMYAEQSYSAEKHVKKGNALLGRIIGTAGRTAGALGRGAVSAGRATGKFIGNASGLSKLRANRNLANVMGTHGQQYNKAVNKLVNAKNVKNIDMANPMMKSFGKVRAAKDRVANVANATNSARKLVAGMGAAGAGGYGYAKLSNTGRVK